MADDMVSTVVERREKQRKRSKRYDPYAGPFPLPEGFMQRIDAALLGYMKELRSAVSWVQRELEGAIGKPLVDLWFDVKLERLFGARGKGEQNLDDVRVTVTFHGGEGRNVHVYSWLIADKPGTPKGVRVRSYTRSTKEGRGEVRTEGGEAESCEKGEKPSLPDSDPVQDVARTGDEERPAESTGPNRIEEVGTPSGQPSVEADQGGVQAGDADTSPGECGGEIGAEQVEAVDERGLEDPPRVAESVGRPRRICWQRWLLVLALLAAAVAGMWGWRMIQGMSLRRPAVGKAWWSGGREPAAGWPGVEVLRVVGGDTGWLSSRAVARGVPKRGATGSDQRSWSGGA